MYNHNDDICYDEEVEMLKKKKTLTNIIKLEKKLFIEA